MSSPHLAERPDPRATYNLCHRTIGWLRTYRHSRCGPATGPPPDKPTRQPTDTGNPSKGNQHNRSPRSIKDSGSWQWSHRSRWRSSSRLRAWPTRCRHHRGSGHRGPRLTATAPHRPNTDPDPGATARHRAAPLGSPSPSPPRSTSWAVPTAVEVVLLLRRGYQDRHALVWRPDPPARLARPPNRSGQHGQDDDRRSACGLVRVG